MSGTLMVNWQAIGSVDWGPGGGVITAAHPRTTFHLPRQTQWCVPGPSRWATAHPTAEDQNEEEIELEEK